MSAMLIDITPSSVEFYYLGTIHRIKEIMQNSDGSLMITTELMQIPEKEVGEVLEEVK